MVTSPISPIPEVLNADKSARVAFPPRFKKTGLPSSRMFYVFFRQGAMMEYQHMLDSIEQVQLSGLAIG